MEGIGPKRVPRTSQAISVLLFSVAGCAQVERFDAQPRSVCAGNPVELSWAARGAVTLESIPPLPESGPKQSAGSQRVTVHTDTRFLLAVQRLWTKDKAQRDVTVTPKTIEFGDYANCDAAARSLVSKFELGGTQISASLKVTSITNINGRAVILQKSGTCERPGGCMDVPLDTGGTSAALAGPAVGTWTINSPLGQGEACDAGLASIAGRLSLRFNLACGE